MGNRHSGIKHAALLWSALVFVVALNLRPAIIAVGPVLPRVGAAFAWEEGLQGLLGALPLLSFAAVSPLVRFASARFGEDRAIFGSLVLLAAGTLVRSYCGAAGVWVGTLVVGAAIAVGNVLVPALVKRDFPDRVAFATGVYSCCVTAGSATASVLAVPLAHGVGGWQAALAFWAVPALVTAALWAARMRLFRCQAGDVIAAPSERGLDAVSSASNRHAMPDARDAARPLWRRGTTWLVTLFMGTQSAVFYTMSNWLPSLALQSGIDAGQAGAQLFVFQVMGAVAGLAIPRLMYVRGNQVCVALAASVPPVLATVGWLVAPQCSLAWALVGGVGQGASLVVALTLISLRARTQAETVALSGIAQSVGYLLAAAGPSVFGALAQASAGWAVPLLFVLAVASAQCVIGVLAGRVHHTAQG